MGQANSIALGCAHLGPVRHVCAFFDGEDEAYRVLLPFIVDGLAAGQKAFHVVRPAQKADHLERLSDAGVDVAAAQARGQLEVQLNTQVYLQDGRFDGDRMLAAFEAMANAKQGYPLSRIVCDMDWACDGLAVFDDVLRFEARVNRVWSQHDDVVICIYDVRQMSGDMVIDVMRTHPMVLIGDVLQENPFFVPPEQFLRERVMKRAGATEAP